MELATLYRILTPLQVGTLDVALEHETVRLRANLAEAKDYFAEHGVNPENLRHHWRERITAITEIREVLGLPALGPDPDEVAL